MHKILMVIVIACSIFSQSEIEPFTEILAPEEGGWFGWSIASLDYNGDGTNDLIVGAPLLRDSLGGRYRGAIYFYNGETDMESPEMTIRGFTESEQLGITIENAGDINSDGWDDLLVGANVTSDVGSAYIFFCGPEFDEYYDLQTHGESYVDNYGYSGTGLGDINLDGHDDFMVGALYNDARGNRTGRAYLYFGGPDLDSIPDMIFTGLDSLDDFATSMDGGRYDFNNDGGNDFLIGAVQAGSYRTSPGEAYCFFGGEMLDTLVDVFTRGENPTDFYGSSVAFIGDANDDGYDDFAIGSYHNSTAAEDAGRVYIYYGGESHDGEPDLIISGRYEENIGGEVASAGDINGDGYDDLAISNDYPPMDYPDSGRGAIMIHLGGIEILPEPSYFMAGEYPTDAFGWSMIATDDLNGDDIGDFVISAPRANERSGKIYIYAGWQPPIRTYSWPLDIKTGSLDNQVLIIGQDTLASAGLEEGLDIVRLPVPPGKTDAGILPNDSIPDYIEYLRRDYRSDESNNIIWHIDVNSFGATSISWNSEILPPGIFLLENVVDMKSIDNTIFNAPRELDVHFVWTPANFTTIDYSPGWNLISLPGYPVEYDTEITLGENAWFFDSEDNIYYHPTLIQTGFGAFVYSTDSISITVPLFNHREPFRRVLRRGWNIIAAPSDTVSVESISTLPDGVIVPSSIYGFDTESGLYTVAEELVPGKGYFMLIAEDCTLDTGAESSFYKRGRQELSQAHEKAIDEFGYYPPSVPFVQEPDIEQNNPSDFIDIYPNPCRDRLNIETEESGFAIYDIEGRRMFSSRFAGSISLDVKDWPAGIYSLKLNNDLSRTYRRIFIVH